MAIEAAYIVPHPPLIIPEIGRGAECEISETIKRYREISRQIAEIKPELVIFISPHSVSYADYIHIAPGYFASGNFASFGAESVSLEINLDSELAEELENLCEHAGFPAGRLGEKSPELDHGVMIPAYFINQHYRDYKALRLSISGLSFYEHYRFGEYLRQAVEHADRKTVVIASGDLSHRLSAQSNYGFNEAAPVFDARVKQIIAAGDFGGFLNFSETICIQAGECGLRAFLIMAGALDGKKILARLLSYEAPFGVGYAVGSFIAGGEDGERRFGSSHLAAIEKSWANESPYVRLARKTLESFVKDENLDEDISDEIFKNRAGVFVSIKKEGALRGCIGTIYPSAANIAEEIKRNAISAGTKDERFAPVEAFELKELVYGVDILSRPEPVLSEKELDTKKYGVIVVSGRKTGLLLPDLEGVDTVAKQLDIAKSKAGIKPGEAVETLKFTVTRYS